MSESQADSRAPIVAAIWQEREPLEPWAPEALRATIPWIAAYAPVTRVAQLSRGPGDWTLVGASCRGRSHAHRAQYREDAFALGSGETVAVMVAADGAGSSAWSRLGAEASCRMALDALFDALVTRGEEPLVALPHAVRDACQHLTALARGCGEAPRAFRTTLLIAALIHSPEGVRLAVCQVGDGAIVVCHADGRVAQVGKGDVGTYSGEVSCFVPDTDAVAQATATTVVLNAADVDCVVLCTDGIDDPFYPIARHGTLLLSQLRNGVKEPAEYFQRQELHGPILGAPDMLERLQSWMTFERRGENDDRTLVAAYRARFAPRPAD